MKGRAGLRLRPASFNASPRPESQRPGRRSLVRSAAGQLQPPLDTTPLWRVREVPIRRACLITQRNV